MKLKELIKQKDFQKWASIIGAILLFALLTASFAEQAIFENVIGMYVSLSLMLASVATAIIVAITDQRKYKKSKETL